MNFNREGSMNGRRARELRRMAEAFPETHYGQDITGMVVAFGRRSGYQQLKATYTRTGTPYIYRPHREGEWHAFKIARPISKIRQRFSLWFARFGRPS